MWLDRLTSGNANIGNIERAGSAALGLGLAIAGFTRQRFVGFAMVAAGVALMTRGVHGRCPIYGALGIDRHSAPNTDGEAIDAVEQASMDSFPASDAPARSSIT